jgi:glycosyltransferase involved in cell wall biosynthesis
MRIVIDLQPMQSESRYRGIGRYSLSLAKAIVRNRGDHEIIIVLNGLIPDSIEPIRTEFENLLPQENIRIWCAFGPIKKAESGNEGRHEAAELIREAFISSLQPDVVLITGLFEGYVDDAVSTIGCFDKKTPVATMLYDLIPLKNPHQYLKPDLRYGKFYLEKIDYLSKSDLLLTISEFSRAEGKANLDMADDKLVNISAAVSDQFRQISLSGKEKEAVLQKFGITRSFVLCTGGSDSRKNLVRLVNAYAGLSAVLRKNHQLVLVGKFPPSGAIVLAQKAKTAGLLADEIIFTGYITDSELVNLYNLCGLFIFPSHYEGFGLPALEAMACGAAVISSNTSSLPEVVGYEDALFNPYSVQSISSKIALSLTNDVFRRRLKKHGLQQAKLFSWDIVALKAIASLEGLVQPRLPTQNDHVNFSETDLIKSISELINESKDLTENDVLGISQAISDSLGEDRKSKIFLDVSQIVIEDHKTGIQRVVRSIMNELLSLDSAEWEIQPVYLAGNQGRWHYRNALNYKNSYSSGICDENNDIADPRCGDVFLGLDLVGEVIHPAELGVFDQWRSRGVKIHFIVYDILPMSHPEWFPAGGGEVHARWLECISRFSDSLVCISEAVSDAVKNYLHNHPVRRSRPLRVSWFHMGADVENSSPTIGLPDDAEIVLTALSERITFLMVGTLEPRKGHLQTLEAFQDLLMQGININLVIVGKKGWMVDALIKKLETSPELNKHLFWLNGISDEYLEKVYASSSCLIAASYGEGFGLPLIEAAQHKLPIIARDIPVFREVAGEHAFYFDDKESTALTTAIHDWLILYKSNKHPRSDLMPWLTWKQSAGQLIDKLEITTLETNKETERP